MEKHNLSNQEKPECPQCGKSDKVGNVISSRGQGGNVVYRKYCRDCLVEFDSKGIMIPPLY